MSQSSDCHMRADGVIIVDSADNIVFADADAVGALRGPADEWVDGLLVPLHDGSCTGNLADHWRLLESLSVADNRGNSDTHHYLVVERAEDNAVCWIQFCIHYAPADDGRPMFVWNVRDITNSARCLDMLRVSTGASNSEYTLSLEDDGFPHSSLLTQVQPPPPSASASNAGGSPSLPAGIDSRDGMAQLLELAANTGAFSVLHLTEFGAVDSVFPRTFLNYQEEQILDRSFVSLLSPEDRVFFCRALRRCYHDGLPQRLILKVADSLLSDDDNDGDGDNGEEEEDGDEQNQRYLDCDVTVLMPEAVRNPVLVVKTNDLLQRKIQQQYSESVSVVQRMRLDSVPIPMPAADMETHSKPAMRAGTPFVHASSMLGSLSRSFSTPSFASSVAIVPNMMLEERQRARSDDEDDDEEDDCSYSNGRRRFMYMPPTPPKPRMLESSLSVAQQQQHQQSLFGAYSVPSILASTLAPSSRFNDAAMMSYSCGSDCSCAYRDSKASLFYRPPASSSPVSKDPAFAGVMDIAVLSGIGDEDNMVDAKTVTSSALTTTTLLDNNNNNNGTRQATRASSNGSASTCIPEEHEHEASGSAFQILCGMTEETLPLASPNHSHRLAKSQERDVQAGKQDKQELVGRVDIPMSKIFACPLPQSVPIASQKTTASSAPCEDDMKKAAEQGSLSLAGDSFISVLENMRIGTLPTPIAKSLKQ
ncbi:hypothetical protein H4217_001298 [Coemansia sp. RSA 1939]|nr:hypothetical protein H4217_001298 [Coemansia sp. RSA 1939]KAJ2616364.1 hypothetical protein EV177_001128 [Coemansia sp. RSA 1804]